MRITYAFMAVLIAGIAMRGTAQVSHASPASPPTGVVTGHVFCADTQHPGRLAEVALLRKPEKAAVSTTSRASAPANQSMLQPQVIYVSAHTHLDGSYVIRDVPPGDYVVVATQEGYFMPISMPLGQVDSNDKEVSLDDLLGDSPVAHVAANQTLLVDVTMRRGGAISGRVLFDDGTPAVGASIQVQPVTLAALNEAPILSQQLLKLTGGRDRGKTDDQGRYRISGLGPGKYRVLATLKFEVRSRVASVGGSQFREDGPAADVGSDLRIYLPGSFRRSEAKMFEIKGDEENIGEDITVPVNELHSVEGRVLAKSDGHVPTLATVSIYMDDGVGGLAFASANGSFRVDCLPKGKYTVRIQASDYETMADGQSGTPKELRRFERTTETVVVGEHDVSMEDVLVVEANPKH